jgi:hypothetical protein
MPLHLRAGEADREHTVDRLCCLADQRATDDEVVSGPAAAQRRIGSMASR